MKNTHPNSTLLKESFSFSKKEKESHPLTILCSPSDYGVIKNKGRCGARWAPRAILNQLGKLNSHLILRPDQKIFCSDITDQTQEELDYHKARTTATQRALKQIPLSQKHIHIGGGHDQIFPLLVAIDQSDLFDNIVILNIDAHCDTRVDPLPNSGTPFRDFDNIGKKPFHLIQYGIQDFANSSSTLSPLQRASEEKIFMSTIRETTNNFHQNPLLDFSSCPFQINDRTAYVFSLDCDAIDSRDMRAVSATNPDGLPLIYISQLQKEFKKIVKGYCFYGIYEFNPVFEDSSLSCLKKISSFIFEILRSEINTHENSK